MEWLSEKEIAEAVRLKDLQERMVGLEVSDTLRVLRWFPRMLDELLETRAGTPKSQLTLDGMD